MLVIKGWQFHLFVWKRKILDDIEKLLKQKIPKEILEGYEPNFDVFLGQKIRENINKDISKKEKVHVQRKYTSL